MTCVRFRELSFLLLQILLALFSGLPLAPSLPVHAAKPSQNTFHLAAPIDLRCAGSLEPLAVADVNPGFQWRVQAASPSLHGVRQASYQVRVAKNVHDLLSGKTLLWDSGKVSGNRSDTANKPYSGPALEPQHVYFWRVRVWDENDHPSPWSYAAKWIQAPVWHGKWIGAATTDVEADNRPLPLLRKGVELKAPVSRAILYVSGLGQYEFRINGAKVGNQELAPGWTDYRKTIMYDTFEVTSLLHPGANALGIMLGSGMYHVPKTPNRYQKFVGSDGPPRCVVQLHMELRDGTTLEIASDETWKSASGPITFSSTYGGEDYDARREITGWDRPGFDDRNWNPVVITDGPGGMLRPELAPPVRVMHTYTPIHRTQPKQGLQVYDLGQNFAGWPVISVAGPPGSSLKLIPGELLNPDGTVSQESSGGPQWFSYTLKGGGTEHWRPRFSYYGFRYVQVEGAAAENAPGSSLPKLIDLRGEAVHTSSDNIGTFESSEKLLNDIHTLIVRAIENNAMSLLTDCPHREKLGWLEETHLLAPSLLYDFDFRGLYEATARNIADAQQSDGPKTGRVPEIAPQYVLFQPEWGPFDDSPEWGSAAVLAPWYLYERYGDKGRLLAHLDVMQKYVDYLSTRAQGSIIAYGLGDWYDIGPGEPGMSKLTSAGFTPTAIYYQDLLVLVKTLALAGKDELSRQYAGKAELVRSDFNRRFFDSANHRYDKGSQTAQAMALVIGLVPDSERSAVLNALIADIRGHQNHVTAGDVGYHYVVDALLDGGHSDVLLDMLERTDSPSYGYQLAQGATALTEAWDADPKSSQDHFMLGDIEEWFYRGLGGIGIDFSASSPRQILLRPQVIGNINSAHARYLSAWGQVESSWRRGPMQTTYVFTVPANATATVELKTTAPRQVLVDGIAAEKAPGVVSANRSEGLIELVIGSGHYRITAPNPN